ncbi:hypothetical protein DFH09DRAFT_1093459 [Mycena vulgaris]|nr:hypothetical protein DFH09DRAFT_1093459 [Mycena vulgaris]
MANRTREKYAAVRGSERMKGAVAQDRHVGGEESHQRRSSHRSTLTDSARNRAGPVEKRTRRLTIRAAVANGVRSCPWRANIEISARQRIGRKRASRTRTLESCVASQARGFRPCQGPYVTEDRSARGESLSATGQRRRRKQGGEDEGTRGGTMSRPAGTVAPDGRHAIVWAAFGTPTLMRLMDVESSGAPNIRHAILKSMPRNEAMSCQVRGPLGLAFGSSKNLGEERREARAVDDEPEIGPEEEWEERERGQHRTQVTQAHG